MPTPLIVALIIGVAIVAFAVRCVIGARQANPAKRLLAAVILVPIGLFCMYGFAAAMEPGDYHIAWRFLYGIVFLTCLLTIGFVFLARSNAIGNCGDDENKIHQENASGNDA